MIGGFNVLIKSLDEFGGWGIEVMRCFVFFYLKYESWYYLNVNCDIFMMENVLKRDI